MQNRTPLILSLLALATLSGCGGQSEETVNQTFGDPMERELASAPPVELPPPLKQSGKYRCKDNSLVMIDYFVGDLQANIRTDVNGPPTRLVAPEVGQPFEAEGYKVEGNGDTVTVTVPGKSAQSCKS